MTESEEMYLVTIARLKETELEGPVPLSQLASELEVLNVSVNQMVRKLEETGLVVYLPYKGVDLTESGVQLAGRSCAGTVCGKCFWWNVWAIRRKRRTLWPAAWNMLYPVKPPSAWPAF